MKEVIYPYNWAPAKHQLEFMSNPARFKVGVWHRKAWKTSMAINELIRWSAAVPGTYWYVSPFLSQSLKIVWNDPDMLPKFIPLEIWDKRNSTDHFIPFPNGSLLYVLGADHPDSLRGPNPTGVVFDEYDDMKAEMWSAIVQPVMTANPKAWCWFIGTYKGRRDLFQKYNFAKEHPNWFSSLLKASKSGIITKEALKEAELSTTRDFYLQDYECEAIEGAGSFFRRIDQNTYEGVMEYNPSHRYQMGWDLAKFMDYTVGAVFDLCTFNAGPLQRFNQIDYNLQKARIEASYLRWGKPKTWMDSTGVGEPVYDDLVQQRITHLYPYKFNEHSRKDLLVNLQVMIEQDKIKLPKDEVLLNELKSFQYALGEQGKIKIEVPDGTHDDCVMALALSCWDTPDHPLPLKTTSEELESVQQFDFYRARSLKNKNYLKYRQ